MHGNRACSGGRWGLRNPDQLLAVIQGADALSWGPDGVHISYTEDRRLRLDFIEGNYTSTKRKPPLNWSQWGFVNAVKRGPAEVRVWHHYNNGGQWKWEKIA